MAFVHLHNHTQYSILDGACKIKQLFQKAKQYNMPAVAITDHGNLYGLIDFYNEGKKQGIKPILGIEAYIINGSIYNDKHKKNRRYHLILLAKNQTGLHNLMKLSSISFIDGFYMKPRLDKAILKKYSEGIIALSACVQGEVPNLLLNNKDEEAYNALMEYKSIFPERFYLEIQNHGLEDEEYAMQKVIELAKKTDTPLVVTNDSHYLNKEDWEAHDILLAIQTGKDFDDPTRMRYLTKDLYFKNEEEMRQLFPELDEAYENTIKIADQIDVELKFDKFLFPKINPPENFEYNFEYLKYLVYEGAKQKYGKITDEIKDRIEYELKIINSMGFNEYFLVVRDFIQMARKMKVPVGPGRGSAAGSIISYLIDITRIDPLKYNLLFERFLDPGRVGMPDIDIDFCAEGRASVIDYIREKYCDEKVAQIITFNTLGAKVALKDVARALKVSAAEANEITKLILDPKMSLEEAIQTYPDFRKKMNSSETLKKVLKFSMSLEGLIRQIGVHAAGVVIAPDDLKKFVPLAISKQKGKEPIVLVQFDGKKLEQLKMLKMDFLGLKTLTQIDKTLKLIKQTKNIDLDIDNIPLDDKKTYEIYSNAETDGIFQFESKGMKSSLINLKPNRFEDLIAMVALYRPGPMKFIKNFIDRKHGKEVITYDHPILEGVLKETYGITVYQEQVMNIAKLMSGFTSSEASALRKAISVKKKDQLDKLEDKFIEGAKKNGVKEEIARKIWKDWQEFANYAFNKSHAAAYAFVSYQTAYLKAHYPIEFMAAILSLEEDTDKISNFLAVCKKMNLNVVPPNVNESDYEFTIKGNSIIYGLKAIKNVGSTAITSIIKERKGEKYKNIFDFCSRVDLQVVNKGVLESLIYAGALDDLEGNRAEKFASIEMALKYGNNIQREKQKAQLTLFSELEAEDPNEFMPKLPKIKNWDRMYKLIKEREYLGFYFSGHPLDEYRDFIKLFTNINSKNFKTFDSSLQKTYIVGLIVSITKKMNRKKKSYAIIKMEDLHGIFNIFIRGDNYEKYISDLKEGAVYYVVGRKSDFKAEESPVLEIETDEIIPFKNLKNKLSGELEINMSKDLINTEIAKQLSSEITKYPGEFSVVLNFKTDTYERLQVKIKDKKVFPENSLLNMLKKISKKNLKVRNFNML